MRPAGHFEALELSFFRAHFVLLDCGHCYSAGGRLKVYFCCGKKSFLENLGIRTIFLGNDLIAGFRGFKLMEINEPQRLELSGCFFLRRPQTKKQCL